MFHPWDKGKCYTHTQKSSGKFLGWPKSLFSFFSMMTSNSTELSLTSSKTILLDYCDSYHISLHFLKILSKVVNFYIAILILRMEETSNIFSILYFTMSIKVKTQLKRKIKICAVFGESAWHIWFIKCVKSAWRRFVLEISCWMVLHIPVDLLKLIAIKQRH